MDKIHENSGISLSKHQVTIQMPDQEVYNGLRGGTSGWPDEMRSAHYGDEIIGHSEDLELAVASGKP
jgi:hypothetical protein